MHILRHEGLLGLYRGLNPAVARGLFYGGALSALHMAQLLIIIHQHICDGQAADLASATAFCGCDKHLKGPHDIAACPAV